MMIQDLIQYNNQKLEAIIIKLTMCQILKNNFLH